VRHSRFYSFVALLSWPFLFGIYRLRARGADRLPEGGFVLAANHVSNFDPWPLGMPLWPGRQLRFMAKSELFWWPMGPVISSAGAFPVRRGEADREAIDKAIELLRAGNVVVMFPEGTRRSKGLRKRHAARFRSGAARIALEAGVPLVPAATKGTDRLARLGPLRVAFGDPIKVDDLVDRPMALAAREATERLMSEILELEASL
jgi:1-acyl-sn-glycerol-3-phosphate acyltransferase